MPWRSLQPRVPFSLFGHLPRRQRPPNTGDQLQAPPTARDARLSAASPRLAALSVAQAHKPDIDTLAPPSTARIGPQGPRAASRRHMPLLAHDPERTSAYRNELSTQQW